MVLINFCLNDFALESPQYYYKIKDGFMAFRLPNQNSLPVNLSLFKHAYCYRLFIIALKDISSENNYAYADEIDNKKSKLLNICLQ